MDAHKREFVRRILAASFLFSIGGLAIWEAIATQESQRGQPPVSLLGGTTQTTTGQSSQQSTTSTGTRQTTSQQTSTSKSSQSTTQQVPAGYLFVTGMAALTGKTSAYFNHPTQGLSMLINLSGSWKAFSATCTHQPCTVQYSGSQIQCPCHGGLFDANNGAVLGGPPPSRLPEMGVVIQNNNLYVSSAVIN